MPDKDQIFIYNKDELSLIKNTFANNDPLLYTIRKVFLQFPLTEAEKGLIKQAVTPEVYAILRKRILPDIGPEYPLGQLPSVLTTLTQDIRQKSVEDMAPQLAAKKIEIDYLTERFDALQGVEHENPTMLSKMAEITGDAGNDYVGLTAYLFLLGYIDPSLLMIKMLAGDKDETPEEQVERLKKDSAK